MYNATIRIELAKANLKQWQLAELLGISEAVMSKRLRRELPQEDQARIIEIIRAGAKGENSCQEC